MMRWFTRNWAELDEPGGDAELANVVLPVTPVEAMQRIQTVATSLRGWKVVQADLEKLQLELTRTTRVLRFVDDIHLRLEIVAGGTRLHGRSQARIGVGDLGQNRRNLLELIRALRREVPQPQSK